MIFERISSVVERKATDVSALTWTELFPQMNAKSGVSVNVDSALRVSTVFACARVLAEGIAQLPKNLFDIDPIKNTKTKNTTHPAAHLLSCEPNEFMSSFELFETMMFHAVLTGNAYAYLGWANGKIVEILPLVPHQVQVIRHADWTLEYSVSDLEGKVTTLAPENVLHLRGPSWNSYLGLEAIQIAREAIGLAIATEETHASLHANGAQPGGVLSVKGKLDKDARERLKTAWQNFQGGVANRFKTAVLDVDADWKPLSMTGVDSQHLETRRFQIEEICRAMRVFPQLVMHSDKTSTFASADAFFLAHVTHSLMPWVIRWEQAINRTVLGDDDNLVCKFNLAALLRGDAASRADFYMKALGGARGETAYMTRNEVRELEDMNPIAGGDKLLLPPPPADPTVAPPGVGGDTAKALELLGTVLNKFNPNHGPDGRFDGPGGNGRVRQAFRAAGGVAVIAAKAILSHLIASGAAHALIRYGLTTFGAGAIAAIAADLAISAIVDHINKSGSLEDVINGLSDEDAKRLASGLVDSLDDDEIQELSAAVTGSKMNPNHGPDGRFASGGGSGAGVHGVGEAATMVKRQWVSENPLKTIDEVYAGVPANKASLDSVGEAVAKTTGTKYIPGPVKKIDRVMAKVARGKPLQGVNDIVRSTFYAESTAQADAVVNALAKTFPVADEGYKRTNAGYFDRSMNVKFPNGQLGEVLIMPEEMGIAKNGSGHKLYEGSQNLPTSHPMQKALLDASIDHYLRVYDKVPDDWKAVVGKPGT